jgi:hypothetical protein
MLHIVIFTSHDLCKYSVHLGFMKLFYELVKIFKRLTSCENCDALMKIFH